MHKLNSSHDVQFSVPDDRKVETNNTSLTPTIPNPLL